MKIFLTGSTGAIGKPLLPLLLGAGHEVAALVRDPAKTRSVDERGAQPVLGDALDRESLTAAIVRSEPEVIIHQATALSAGSTDVRRFDEHFAVTNRLRREATDTMIAAARQVGARRLIVQSFCGWSFAREGGPVKSEEERLDPDPPPHFGETLAALKHVEDAVRQNADLHAMALRYGIFYGPGTAIAEDGEMVGLVRKRRLPIVGDGGGVWSFTHIEDAAAVTLAAVSRGEPGIYNVVDDEPAPVAEWLPALADAAGAAPPRRVPAWLARLVIGKGGVKMMTESRGSSNAKAKRELQWQPEYPTWRSGFRAVLG